MYEFISPFELKTISQTRTFLISSGTNEQILFEMISGSIGITVLGKYIDVPLLKASLSNSVLGKTTDETSAMATLSVYEDFFTLYLLTKNCTDRLKL